MSDSSDSMSISSQEPNDSSLPVTDEEWEQMEKDLHSISLLQQDALERMERLSQALTSSNLRELQNIIQQCHEQSLEQLPHTHQVTFGQLLLQHLSV